MPYRFQLNEPIEDGIRRICQGQIGHAIISLKLANTPSSGVHEARKSIKKVRAVLKLIQCGIDKETYARSNIFLRDTSRHLSATRDAQVMKAVLLKFRHHPELQISFHNILNEIHEIILENQKQVQSHHINAKAEQVIHNLEQAIGHFDTLPFQISPLEALFMGFEKSYLKAVKLMRNAYSLECPDAFHDWRKALQYHGRHLQLFLPAWPELLKLKLTATREISLILGEHNDLSVLTGFIQSQASALSNKKELRRFLKILSTHEYTLRMAARPRGIRLFADTPEDLQHHLKIYWKTAQTIEPLDKILFFQEEEQSTFLKEPAI